MKMVPNKFGKCPLLSGDRFVWNTHRWFIVEFLPNDDVAIRLEGTSDVATLPEIMVSELVEEFRYQHDYWRRP